MMDGINFLRDAESRLRQRYHTAYCILRSSPDAEDAVQQALFKAWAALDRESYFSSKHSVFHCGFPATLP